MTYRHHALRPFLFRLFLFVTLASLPTTEIANALQAPESPAAGVVRVHYRRADGAYDRWGLWVWDDVKTPSNPWPTGALRFSGRDEFGAWVDVEPATTARKIGFLIVDHTNGDKESGSKGFIMTSHSNHLYIREGDDRVYLSADLQATPELRAATVTASGTIRVVCTDAQAIDAALTTDTFALKSRSGQALTITEARVSSSDTVRLSAAFSLTDDVPLTVTFAGRTVAAPLSWQLIDELYAYDGDDLGCRIASGQAHLALWAPLATGVEVLLFDGQDQTRQIGRRPLSRTDRGVWRATLSPADISSEKASVENLFYQFEITNPGRAPKRVLDPYARSMAPVTVSPDGLSAGASGDFVGKAALVAPETIGVFPSRVQIDGYQKREDAIIYEVHVRDFTSDPAVGSTLKARWGSFRAFREKLAYIKSLGVTHVQLLPVMAWYFGDETRMTEREMHWSTRHNQYNWGYDPQSYFSLDGAYSEKPDDPSLRISEFKELVQSIHDAGMGVILDVVYTHMANGAFLDDIVPDYYFFRDPQGNLLGDFGNNLATNRKMAEKLLIDSVRYWFGQFGIDGMRFDMMGDATQDAIQRAFDAAKAINPQTIFIGEGWRTFKGHLEDPALTGKGADQDWMAHTDSVGVFSDEFRNELKSGFGSEGEPMFVTGGPRRIATLFNAIKAQPSNTPAKQPGAMVQYIEAHDNMTLHDIIAQAIKKDPEVPENECEIQRRIRLGNAILLTSQGTAFLHAGQEWGRTKQWLGERPPEHKFHELRDAAGKPFKHPYFIHDSYDSSDAVNRFDWAKATDEKRFSEHTRTRAFTTGLIALRRSSDAFRLPTQELVHRNVVLIEAPEIRPEDLVIAWRCTATTGETFRIFVNADSAKRTLSLPKSEIPTDHAVVVDATQAGTTPIASPTGFARQGDRLTLEPLTVIVFRQ